MTLIYVDEELHKRLKDLARTENRPMVAVIRHRIFSSSDVPTPDIDKDEVLSEASDASSIPEERWEQTKKQLGIKCGCTFDDEMNVFSVTDWKLFRTISNGKLAEKYLAAHPDERNKIIVQ